MLSPSHDILNVSVETLIAPAHIANLALSMLFGITIIQTYVYFGRAGRMRDGASLKCLILFLWILDVLHYFLVSSTHYHYVITNFNRPGSLRYATWRASTLVFVTASSDLIVRGIFTYRLWKFSERNFKVVIILSLGCLLNFVASIAYACRTIPMKWLKGYDFYSWMIYLAMGSAAAIDIAIAVAQCILLRTHRREQSGSSQTRSVVRWLMVYSINTGALTSICATLCLIFYATMRWNTVYDAFYWTLPTLYFNALLATLNARKKLRRSLEGQMLPLANFSAHTLAVPQRAITPLLWQNSLRREAVEAPQIPFHRPLSSLSMRVLDAAMDAFALDDSVGKDRSSFAIAAPLPSLRTFDSNGLETTDSLGRTSMDLRVDF